MQIKYALMAGTFAVSLGGSAMAQGTSAQPAPKQSAPAESSHASGHDAQSGRPETGPNAAKTEGKASGGYKDAQDRAKK
jgi:hypothetical protein